MKLYECGCEFEEIKNDANTEVKGYILVSECDACKEKRKVDAEKAAKEKRKQDIIAELNELDKKVIRPLLDGETERVNSIKAQKVSLRAELESL